MNTTAQFELPELTHRDLTSLQFLDGCRRITSGVLEGTPRIPVSDALVREVASDGAKNAEELASRLILDRKGEFTRDKAQANSKRIELFHAVRRDVKHVLRHPDPEVPEEKKAAAKELLTVLDKHPISTKRRSQAEVTGVVHGLLAETASKDVQRLIADAGLSRLFDLLKAAQDKYAAITKQEEESAVLSPGAESAEGEAVAQVEPTEAGSQTAPAKPRLAREIKDALNADLALLFVLMMRQAQKGREPYALLLAKCREITSELNQVAKTRDTREKRAEAKRKKKEAAGASAGAPQTGANPKGNGTVPAARASQPAANADAEAARTTTPAPVTGAKGGDSALAG